MQNRNISDIIEQYLKSILKESPSIEIKRSEIAQQLDCVPSQINYVIKTRFTVQNGYLVESKRGGGGYIRIEKVDLVDDAEYLNELIEYTGESITETDAFKVVQALYENHFLNRREANLILSTFNRNVLAFSDHEIEDIVRARILKSVINRLKCAD